MEYIIEHTRIGIELPEILAFILLIAVIVFFIVRHKQMKKQERELIDEIQEVQRQEAERKRAQAG